MTLCWLGIGWQGEMTAARTWWPTGTFICWFTTTDIIKKKLRLGRVILIIRYIEQNQEVLIKKRMKFYFLNWWVLFHHLFTYHICSNIATPAKTHLDGFALVFKLNVQMYVGPVKKIVTTLRHMHIYIRIYPRQTHRQTDAMYACHSPLGSKHK